jgi:hypothetical protein
MLAKFVYNRAEKELREAYIIRKQQGLVFLNLCSDLWSGFGSKNDVNMMIDKYLTGNLLRPPKHINFQHHTSSTTFEITLC